MILRKSVTVVHSLYQYYVGYCLLPEWELVCIICGVAVVISIIVCM